MNKLPVIVPALLGFALLCFSACHHVDDTEFKEAFNQRVKAIDEADVPVQPAQQVTAPAVVTGTAKPASTPLPAATPTKTATPEPKRKINVKELNIKSDTVTFARESTEALFEGNVRVAAEGILLKAKRLKSKDYRKEAEASGNVVAVYKQHNLTMTSNRFIYANAMNRIQALEEVVAVKVSDRGDTITMYSDGVDFDAFENTMAAEKKKKRVKIKFKDIVAFSDKVLYNDDTHMVKLEGMPIVRKKETLFTGDEITINTETQTMKMKTKIWSKIFYRDFERAKKEAESEISKDTEPR